jgi:peptidoglycan hydrolase FlgJ
VTVLPSLTALTDPTRTSASSSVRMPERASAAASKQTEAFRQFESFILQSFIETMLPKNAESVFGSGTAGGVWKSMLAEKLADQISRSGGIGIAQRIAKGSQAASSLPHAGQATQGIEATPPLIRTYRSGDQS